MSRRQISGRVNGREYEFDVNPEWTNREMSDFIEAFKELVAIINERHNKPVPSEPIDEDDYDDARNTVEIHDIIIKMNTRWRDETDDLTDALFTPEKGDPYFIARKLKLEITYQLDTLIEIFKEKK